MLNRNKQREFDGPIPGENFTSDTRNYPWHRPPVRTSYQEVVDTMIKKLNAPERTAMAIAMMETGESIVDIVTGMTRIGVAKGKMTIDMGILAAGPLARMLEVIAEKAGIEYERGWDQEPRVVTADLIRAMGGQASDDIDPSVLETVADVEDDTEEMMGLMAQTDEAAPEELQDEMLGSKPDDEEEIV